MKAVKSEECAIAAALLALSFFNPTAPALSQVDSRTPRFAPAYQITPSTMHTIEPKNVPDFAPSTQAQPGAGDSDQAPARIGNPSAGTALRAEAASGTIPVSTKLTLVLETPVDAKSSIPGDLFEAHVKDDLSLGTTLLLARGSLVRGRVVDVTKPRLLSRAAKIGLKLEQIDTPTGEVIPLDAALEFRKGTTNARGQLDPGTSLGSRVNSEVKSVTGMNSTGSTRGVLVAANVATLGAPAVATMIGGSVIGVFRSGDNVSLKPGQELEVMLTNDLGLQVN
ncbi:MAG TPA: hypothetical protein V6C72_10100 [Chroococcales cyanobacterium]